jgi:major membrane immunogen (membrane-anchored lipoprotein)
MAAKKRKKARRTTHRSSKGKKLYAVRDAKGRFKDIQQYSRAHRMDIKRKSKSELAAAKKTAKKAAKKRKPAKRKVVTSARKSVRKVLRGARKMLRGARKAARKARKTRK